MSVLLVEVLLELKSINTPTTHDGALLGSKILMCVLAAIYIPSEGGEGGDG